MCTPLSRRPVRLTSTQFRRIVAVKIRLKRLGKIRAPYYRIVVADSRTKRDGRVIEEIGKYHPTEEPSFIEVDSERAQYWLERRRAADRAGHRAAEAHRRLGQVQGRQERRLDRARSPSPRPRSRSTPRKKSSSSPRLRRRPRSPQPRPPAEADADAADRRRVIVVLAAALEHVVKGIVDHPDDVSIRLVDVAARRRPRGPRAPR